MSCQLLTICVPDSSLGGCDLACVAPPPELDDIALWTRDAHCKPQYLVHRVKVGNKYRIMPEDELETHHHVTIYRIVDREALQYVAGAMK